MPGEGDGRWPGPLRPHQALALGRVTMNWGEERYVRIYVRDTPAWCALSFNAQALFVLIMRKVDRGGRLPLGRLGRKGVAVVLAQVALWDAVIAPALRELEADGSLLVEGSGDSTVLLVPGFRDAQEATASGAARTRKWRDGRPSDAAGDDSSRAGDASSPERDECDPVPCRAVPYRAEPPNSAQAADAAAAPTRVARPAPVRDPDPRHQQLTEGLLADFAASRGAPYGYAGPKDAKAVAALLKLATQAVGPDRAVGEARRRWCAALAFGDRWPGCASIALLPGRWNEIGPPSAPQTALARLGDLGADNEDWWRWLPPADLDAFRAERQRIDPSLVPAAPIQATGFVEVDRVEELIASYRARARSTRVEASR